MVREKIGRCTVMHESQHIDCVDTHVLTDGIHENSRDLNIVHGSFQERQLHQPEDNRIFLFDAPQDDAESHSKISGGIMIDTHDPPWAVSRSPDGWDQIPRWAGGWACSSHPGVLGSIPKREEPGKTGRHPVLKYRVPHGSHPPRTQLYNRSCSNKHTHLLEFSEECVDFQLMMMMPFICSYRNKV